MDDQDEIWVEVVSTFEFDGVEHLKVGQRYKLLSEQEHRSVGIRNKISTLFYIDVNGDSIPFVSTHFRKIHSGCEGHPEYGLF
ncbi:MAG: hypothetical protein ACEQSB_00485 [Undibacterium sp.]